MNKLFYAINKNIGKNENRVRNSINIWQCLIQVFLL